MEEEEDADADEERIVDRIEMPSSELVGALEEEEERQEEEEEEEEEEEQLVA